MTSWPYKTYELEIDYSTPSPSSNEKTAPTKDFRVLNFPNLNVILVLCNAETPISKIVDVNSGVVLHSSISGEHTFFHFYQFLLVYFSRVHLSIFIYTQKNI